MHFPRSFTAVFALVISLAVAAPAVALVTPERVIGERHVTEFLPFANDTWFAWTTNTERRPRQLDAFARPLEGGARTRLNEVGTTGFTGSFEPGTNTTIYQQVDRGSNLFLYDLDTDERMRVPDVNTPDWEWSPRISSDYVLFNRDTVQNGRLFTTMWITDRAAGTSRRIDRWFSRSATAVAGGVGSTYATYSVCTRATCKAFVYTIADRESTRIPSGNDRPVYAAVVDEDNGDLYFMRSGFGCGANVGIWRLPVDDLDATPTKIVDLENGLDSASAVASLAPNASVGGSQDLYFDRFICRNGEIDVFVARDVTSEIGAMALGRGAADAAGGGAGMGGFRRIFAPNKARP